MEWGFPPVYLISMAALRICEGWESLWRLACWPDITWVESHEATPELMTESTGEKTTEAAFGPTQAVNEERTKYKFRVTVAYTMHTHCKYSYKNVQYPNLAN